MMFKGTETVSAEEFTRRMQEKGGAYNAFTSHDFAGYFEKIAAAHVRTALDLEGDRMQHLTFTDEEFDTERQVVMEKRRLRIRDNPQAYLREQVNASAFQSQPYHWPISGWMPDLRRLSPADARQWYRTYYHPANACIVAVGDFNTDRLMGKIRNTFGSIPAGNGPFRTEYKDPPQQGERRLRVNSKKKRFPFLIMGFHAPNISSPDSYALEIMTSLLAGGRSARLQKHLVYRSQIARQAQTGYSLLSHDPDLFVIYAEPFPGVDIARLESEIDKQIQDLWNAPVEEKELQKAKNQLEAAFVFSQDSILHQAILLARYELAVGWQKVNDYISSIRSVTAEDVRQAAQRYLVRKNRTTGVLIPQGQEKSLQMEERSWRNDRNHLR